MPRPFGNRGAGRAFTAAGAVLLGAVTGAPGGGGARARAEVIYVLAPSLSLGITDNAQSVATTSNMRVGDEFGTAAVAASVRREGARSTHALSYNLAYTRFFEHHGADTLTNLVAWTSLLRLSAVLDLTLGASAGLASTSRVDVNDLTTVMPQGSQAGSSQFLSTGVSENLSYRPDARRSYLQSLSAGQVRYLGSSGLPTTTFVAIGARGSRIAARDTFFVNAELADAFTTTTPAMPAAGSFGEGHTFLAQLTAGWRREVSPFWATELQAGPMAVFKLSGTAVIAPAASAALTYQRRPWFATLALSQGPAINLYLGEATINDQALLRAALPLNQSDTLFVAGYAAYIYARTSNGVGISARAFDERTAGASLSARLRRLPLAASLQYTVVDQNGSAGTGRAVPSLVRQTLMATIGGVFAWGPGTPPLFSGGL